MPAPRTAWCGGCLAEQTVNARWRALWVDSYGRLLTSPALPDGEISLVGPDTVLVCGDGSALRVMERYLSEGSLDSTLHRDPDHTQPEAFADLT